MGLHERAIKMTSLHWWMFFCLTLFIQMQANAHPVEIGSLQIAVVEGNRLKFSLKLQAQTAATFAKLIQLPSSDSELAALAERLFSATIGRSSPQLSGDTCVWRKPSLSFTDNQRQMLDLDAIAVCTQAQTGSFALDFPLPFLKETSPDNVMVVDIEGAGEPLSFMVSANKPIVHIGEFEKPDTSFVGFLVMGMGHIGALPGEWKSKAGEFQLPEGLDHICFVLALIVAGGTLTGLLKNVTGFTIGHSLTLGLSAFQIIHIHSSWVESLIALSIAYVAGASLIRTQAPHRWVVAALFGTVHGLGFASVLQELDMNSSEILPALLGFNIGVEFGQIVIVAATLPVLLLIKNKSPEAAKWTNHSMAMVLLVVGSYWFYQRVTSG